MRCKLCSEIIRTDANYFSVCVEEMTTFKAEHLTLTFHSKCWLKLFTIELTPLGFEGSAEPDFSVVIRTKEKQRIPLTLSDT